MNWQILNEESELEELVGDCKEISGILTNCISQM